MYVSVMVSDSYGNNNDDAGDDEQDHQYHSYVKVEGGIHYKAA
jgi:hypothetical protein